MGRSIQGIDSDHDWHCMVSLEARSDSEIFVTRFTIDNGDSVSVREQMLI